MTQGSRTDCRTKNGPPTRPPKGERKTTTNPKPENNNKPQARKQQQTLSHNNKTKPKQQQHNKPRTTTNPEQQQTPNNNSPNNKPPKTGSPIGPKILGPYKPSEVPRRGIILCEEKVQEIASCPIFPGSQHTTIAQAKVEVSREGKVGNYNAFA